MSVLSPRATAWQTPYEVLDWGLALHPSLLASGEQIVSGGWTLSATDAALGVELENLGLATGDDGTLAVWARISIAVAQREHARWSGRGTVILPAATLTTNRDRVWWREVPITVMRGAWAASPRVLVIGPAEGDG